MNKSTSENRPLPLSSIALAGAFAALVVTLLSLAAPARGGAGAAALYPPTIKLTDPKVAHWAGGMNPGVVATKPGLLPPIVTTRPPATPDGTRTLVPFLPRAAIAPTKG